MAEAKVKEHDDITFSRDRLLDDDPEVRDEELHKRVKPLPEQFRSDPAEAGMWPLPEDRLPAVMRADQKDSNEYKMDTVSEIDRDTRNIELEGTSGDVARAEVNKAIREDATLDMNKLQAPPTKAAQLAAEGKGAETNPIPVVDRKTGEQLNGPAPAVQRTNNKK